MMGGSWARQNCSLVRSRAAFPAAQGMAAQGESEYQPYSEKRGELVHGLTATAVQVQVLRRL